ncbi:MAG: glycoside hydrolase family 5 protein [Chthonomonadales bacterium]|nr:glycoside hydrolase family 5 protein [Chthonomonadales bacterium]
MMDGRALAVAAAMALASMYALAQPGQGEVIFASGFEGGDAGAGWSSAPKLDAGHASAQAAVLERTDAAGPSAMIVRTLPAERMRGCVIACSAWIKAENVSEKPQPWNGIKFMIPIEAPSGRQWPQARIGSGSFEWTQVRFAVRVPADAEKMSLMLGLEAVTGKVWFDDVKIAIAKPPHTEKPKPSPVMHRGHSLPRLRGAMISPRSLTEADLRTLGQEWNANLVRWQLIRITRPGQSASLDEWDRWLEEELKRLDAMLPLCEKYGLYVALDLHSPPGGVGTAGGYAGSDTGLFTDKACQDRFVKAWEHMARRYKGQKVIWGFDLANEPVEDAWDGECDDWQALAERTAKAIRAIDPDRTIIVEPAEWGGPGGLRSFRPIAVPNVVYSVHMYLPHEFTHQGVHSPSAPIRYPGEIGGKRWDKAALKEALQPAIEFQKAYNVHIYIGEFSAIRWAPDQSAYRYLKDLIEVMEELGWDWSYHAFREWSGWSVEHGEDRADENRAAKPTQRQELLMGWFAKNRKPAWTGKP